ncbi:oxamate carbamoyltransferase subunit AllH family protein [Streptomyces sp. BYX5S]
MSPALLPCTVSTLARDLLAGPARPARVVAVARQALYLAPYGDDAPLAVVTPRAVRVPTAVVVPRAAGERPFDGLAVGNTGRVGGGRLAVGHLYLTAGKFWAPPRAQDTPRGPVLERLAALRPPRPLAAEARRAATALVRALAHGTPSAQRRRADALLGLGPGATPSGDDFLCGLLLAARLPLRPPHWLPVLLDTAGQAAARTAPVSAALLRHAADGYCVPQVAAVLRAAATCADLGPPVADLSTVGHTSGNDLLHGLCATARLDRSGPTAGSRADRPGARPRPEPPGTSPRRPAASLTPRSTPW